MQRVTLIARDCRGRMRSATPLDLAIGALDWMVKSGGFTWMKLALEKYCLSQAQAESSSPSVADMWIERYRAIREVK